MRPTAEVMMIIGGRDYGEKKLADISQALCKDALAPGLALRLLSF
jgi:hypothetical protein